MTREPIELGRAIAFLRGSRSQVEAAQRASLDPATWSHYESGRRLPRSGNLEKVLRGLGCTRLQLEETAWRFRRQRLVEQLVEQAGASSAIREGHPAPPGHVRGASRDLRHIEVPSDDEVLEARLQRISGQLAASFQELFLLLTRVVDPDRERNF